MATIPIRGPTRAPRTVLPPSPRRISAPSTRANFARSGLHVAVVGDIDAATLKQKLDQVFGDLPEKQLLQPVADIELKLGQQLEVDYDLPQTSLQFAYPGVKRDAPDFFRRGADEPDSRWRHLHVAPL